MLLKTSRLSASGFGEYGFGFEHEKQNYLISKSDRQISIFAHMICLLRIVAGDFLLVETLRVEMSFLPAKVTYTFRAFDSFVTFRFAYFAAQHSWRLFSFRFAWLVCARMTWLSASKAYLWVLNLPIWEFFCFFRRIYTCCLSYWYWQDTCNLASCSIVFLICKIGFW